MSWGQKPREVELPWMGLGVFHGFSPVSLGDGNNKPGSALPRGRVLLRALQVQLPRFPFPQCPLLLALKKSTQELLGKAETSAKAKAQKVTVGEMPFREPEEEQKGGFLQGGKSQNQGIARAGRDP